MTGSFFLRVVGILVLIIIIGRLSRRRGPTGTRDESTAEKGLSQDHTNVETQTSEEDLPSLKRAEGHTIETSPLPSEDQTVPSQASEQPQRTTIDTPDKNQEEEPVDKPTAPMNKPEQQNMTSRAPAPPEATPVKASKPEPKPPTTNAKPYKAIRVLFLSWDNERNLTTPAHALMNKLRSLLGLTYHFTILEFSIPTAGPESSHPSAALLKYLLQKGLLLTSLSDSSSSSSDDSSSDDPEEGKHNELLIVIYSGHGIDQSGRYYLATKLDKSRREHEVEDDSHHMLPGCRTMAWEWFERRIASAGYDSLCVLNASYVPKTPVTAREVRGANMVLAAAGPETGFYKEILLESKKEKEDEQGKDTYIRPWSTGFLEIVVRILEEGAEEKDGKVPVDEMFKRLVLEHDRAHVNSGPSKGKDDGKRPYLGYIKGKDGEYEDRIIDIWLDGAAGKSKKAGGKGKNASSAGEEWTFC